MKRFYRGIGPVTLRLRGEGVDQETGEESSKTDDGEDHPEIIRGSPLTDILDSLPLLWKVEPDDALHEECTPEFQPLKEEESTETGDDPDDDGDEYDPPEGGDGLLNLHGCKNVSSASYLTHFT